MPLLVRQRPPERRRLRRSTGPWTAASGVLGLIAEAHADRDAASRLRVSPADVRVQITRIAGVSAGTRTRQHSARRPSVRRRSPSSPASPSGTSGDWPMIRTVLPRRLRSGGHSNGQARLHPDLEGASMGHAPAAHGRRRMSADTPVVVGDTGLEPVTFCV